MSSSDESDKPHEATHKKLADAKKKGQVPASSEIVSALVFTFLIPTIYLVMSATISRYGGAFMRLVLDEARNMDGDNSIPFEVVSLSFSIIAE